MDGITIVALGDSTTAGTPGFKSPLESPPGGDGNIESQYSYWLTKKHVDWQVLNRGVNGERSDQIHARFDRDVLGAEPAAVVIIAGVNDIYQGRAADTVQRELEAMYAAAPRAVVIIAGVNDVYQGLPVEHVTGNLAAMYAHASRAGIAIVAGSIIPYNTATPEHNARMQQINDWIRGQAGLSFVDTRAAVAASNDPDRLLDSTDGLHPTAAGYRRMADAIQPILERVVRDNR